MAAKLREPVGWEARLRVVPGSPYTEVAGTPVAVVLSTAAVVVLSPAAAGLLARLDGRPLAEVLDTELSAMPASSRRRLLELVRRLKAAGLVEDAPVGAPSAGPAWDGEAATIATVTVAGRVEAPGPVLVLRQGEGPVTIGESEGGGSPFAVVDAPPPDPGQPAAHGAMGVFAALARGLEPTAQLRRPGVADLLAELAEAATLR